MATRVCNVLFVCTGNPARSIIAEGLMNDAARGRFKANPAGTLSLPMASLDDLALQQEIKDIGNR